MNLPNKLTMLRVCTIPFFVLLMEVNVFGNDEISRYVAMLLFIFASITDALDGHIARKYNLITNFGKFMDPLADKLLVCAAMICLVNKIPVWVIIVIISRELIISGFRIVAADNGIVIAAGWWGKVKTTVQMIMVIALLLPWEQYDWLWYDVLSEILIYASLILTVISLIDYFIKNSNVLKEQR